MIQMKNFTHTTRPDRWRLLLATLTALAVSTSINAQAPENFRIEYDACGMRYLRWAPVPAADQYTIERRPGCCDCMGNDYMPFATVAAGTTEIPEPAVLASSYRISAVSNGQVLGTSSPIGDPQPRWLQSIESRRIPNLPDTDICFGQIVHFGLAPPITITPNQYEWRRNGALIAITYQPSLEYLTTDADDGAIITVSLKDCDGDRATWPPLRFGRDLPGAGIVRWTTFDRYTFVRQARRGPDVPWGVGCFSCYAPGWFVETETVSHCLHNDELQPNGGVLRAGVHGSQGPPGLCGANADIDAFGCTATGMLEAAAMLRLQIRRTSCISPDPGAPPTIVVSQGNAIVYSSDCDFPWATEIDVSVPMAQGAFSIALSPSIPGGGYFWGPKDLVAELIFTGPLDCNGNGRADKQDISAGTSFDIDQNGTPDECQTVHVPGDYGTIQAAIDAAPANSMRIVDVAAGTYAGPIDFKGKPLIVRGASTASTVIDGASGQTLSVVRFTGGEPSIAALERLTVRGGTTGTPIPGAAFVGGGIYGVDSAANVRSCIIENNIAGFGGGAYFLRCTGSVTDCVIRNNSASADGGGFQTSQGNQDLSDVVIQGNMANSRGAGMHIVQGTNRLTRVQVLDNVCGNIVGGISFSPSGTQPMLLELMSCSICRNTAGVAYGGIAMLGSTIAPISMDSTTVCDNVPRPNMLGAYSNLGGNTICDCAGDLNVDGVVNGADLGLMLSSWGFCGTTCPYDLNNDGRVNGGDLGLLLSGWGTCGN